MADELPTLKLPEGAHALMVVVVTTAGTQVLPLPILEQITNQVDVARQIAGALRETAQALEADADLVDAINDVEEAMDP